MFTTSKTVRVLGFVGVTGALALLQACSLDESGEAGVNDTDQAILLSKGGGKGGDNPRPMPPEGYQVRYSTCTYYVEGEGNVRNNSRIVNIAPDGTLPIQRAEHVADGKDNYRRFNASRLPKGTLRGTGEDRQTGNTVEFVKLGQVVVTKENDGTIVQWIIGSEQLGNPVLNKNTGHLEYRDHCFRNPKLAGRDTAGYIEEGIELATSCVVEDINQSYNALSAYGYKPLVNFATTKVATANDPASRPHPDRATYEGFDGAFMYGGEGAALNDINGAERDGTTAYLGGESYCHMIVNAGLEVPGSKRPATRSLPAPGVVNGKTLITWKPVNPNVTIADDKEPTARDQIEPEPEPVSEPVDADTDTRPM